MDDEIKELMRLFPQIDRLMAETILKLHEQEKLSKYFQDDEEETHTPVETVLHTVHVE